MILTLTLNPTIDHVFFVSNFRLGEIVRAQRETRTPSGKGIGCSLVVRELGGETVALGFSAGLAGDMLSAMLSEIDLTHRFIQTEGETRIATVLVDAATNQQSTISAATLHAAPQHLADLLLILQEYTGRAKGIICAGSLPPGLPDDSYRIVVEYARSLGLRTMLDTSGRALEQGIRGLPHILKVNDDELRSLDPGLSLSLATPDAAQRSLVRLSRMLGVWASDAIIVTLGSKGSLAVTWKKGYVVQPPEVAVVNTTGAGDALSAGVMLSLSREECWKQALVWGTAAAASVVMNEGTAICRRSQVEDLLEQVTIQEIEVHD